MPSAAARRLRRRSSRPPSPRPCQRVDHGDGHLGAGRPVAVAHVARDADPLARARVDRLQCRLAPADHDLRTVGQVDDLAARRLARAALVRPQARLGLLLGVVVGERRLGAGEADVEAAGGTRLDGEAHFG